MKISPYAIENIAPYIVGAKTGREIIKFFRKSGKLLFVPYTKDFGRITRF